MYRILAVALFCFGLFCLGGQAPRAQLTMTGIGAGAVGGGGGGTTVTVNATGTEKYQAVGASLDYTNITVAAGSNTSLLACLTRRDNSVAADTGIALTWDNGGTNQAMSLMASSLNNLTTGNNLAISQLWLRRNPTTGNKTLHVAWTNAVADNFVVAIAFDGVNNTSDGTAIPHTQVLTNVNGSSVSVTSTTGNKVVGCYGGGSAVAGILGTVIFTDNTSGSIINAGADYDVGAASVSVGTAAATLNSIAGVDVAHP